jgi:alkaline phosphatase D
MFRIAVFGHVAIDGATEIMTVTLKDVDNRTLWSVPIEPRLEQWSGGRSLAGG